MDENPTQKAVDEFILHEIDTVPHLEALLLLWNSRPQEWSFEGDAQRPVPSTRPLRARLLRTWKGADLVLLTDDHRFLAPFHPPDQLVEQVEKTYRREIVRISNMIHSKPAASLREFARAFRLKRDRD